MFEASVLWRSSVGSSPVSSTTSNETIMNTINPAWQTKFEVSYKFEPRQMLKFDVYDRDSKSVKIQDHDFLGSCECSLEEVVSA